MLNQFYAAFAPLSFTVYGLWLIVVQTRHADWRRSPEHRRRAYAVSLHFAIPGLMSLLALVDPANSTMWRGEIQIEEAHPFMPRGDVAEVADGCAFVPSFANVSAVATDDGLVLVDTGSQLFARTALDDLRRWSADRVHTAVYSHGHIDHVFGVPLIEEEASTKGWAPPTVIAHEALPARFYRYILTAGYN